MCGGLKKPKAQIIRHCWRHSLNRRSSSGADCSELFDSIKFLRFDVYQENENDSSFQCNYTPSERVGEDVLPFRERADRSRATQRAEGNAAAGTARQQQQQRQAWHVSLSLSLSLSLSVSETLHGRLFSDRLILDISDYRRLSHTCDTYRFTR